MVQLVFESSLLSSHLCPPFPHLAVIHVNTWQESMKLHEGCMCPQPVYASCLLSIFLNLLSCAVLSAQLFRPHSFSREAGCYNQQTLFAFYFIVGFTMVSDFHTPNLFPLREQETPLQQQDRAFPGQACPSSYWNGQEGSYGQNSCRAYQAGDRAKPSIGVVPEDGSVSQQLKIYIQF